MNKADSAEELFRMGYNCSQSVYAAFAEDLGMSVEEAAKRASPFGAGFGKLREVCGAVSGMVLVLGDLCGYQDPTDAAGKQALYALVQRLCGSFEKSEGSLICRELLADQHPDTAPNPTPRTDDFYRQRPCARFVEDAARILDAYLEKEPPKNNLQ